MGAPVGGAHRRVHVSGVYCDSPCREPTESLFGLRGSFAAALWRALWICSAVEQAVREEAVSSPRVQPAKARLRARQAKRREVSLGAAADEVLAFLRKLPKNTHSSVVRHQPRMAKSFVPIGLQLRPYDFTYPSHSSARRSAPRRARLLFVLEPCGRGCLQAGGRGAPVGRIAGLAVTEPVMQNHAFSRTRKQAKKERAGPAFEGLGRSTRAAVPRHRGTRSCPRSGRW